MTPKYDEKQDIYRVFNYCLVRYLLFTNEKLLIFPQKGLVDTPEDKRHFCPLGTHIVCVQPAVIFVNNESTPDVK